MKFTRFAALFGTLATALAAPLIQSLSSDIIPGKFVVQLKPGIAPADVQAHHVAVRSLHSRSTKRDESVGIEKTFQFADFNAYGGSFDEATIDEISKLPEVLSVEPDQVVRLAEITTQSNAQWGLGSISHRTPNQTEYIYDSSAGEGTYAYVCDTGIRITHTEFDDGRATFGYNAVAGGADTDIDGHGTHVAGTVAGKTYGVAKKANVISVKVVEGETGTSMQVLDGINWAINDIIAKGRQSTSVLQLSLSTPTFAAMDNIVANAYDIGILSIVAAGNDGDDANNWSPAREPKAFTVGNIQRDNSRRSSSNWGTALDVFAPGTDILSASHLSDTGSALQTGTSMACPAVAGLVCYLRALEGLSSVEAVTARIIELSTKDVVTDAREGSPNRLAYNGSGQ
ncbi:oryzin precursor [Melanomma pulvis-pyrius CBS 109.77]|uniref:Oryzin n=1 Tax=Melanomma pulvis-pyrius CBS 109.77 TaxID=1314802 RepID=A0A6A6XFY9_9PLEO|nr:oryzin precursor [Melanomma pulvis-pyrius CBS 109.77]